MKLIIAFVLFWLGQNIILGQKIDPNDIIDVQFSVEQKDSCISFVVAKIKFKQKSWHINSVELPQGSRSLATTFDINKSSQIKVLETIEPKPKTIYDPVIKETLSYHEGNIEIKRKFINSSRENFKISGSFGFQLCDEVQCLPQVNKDFSLEVNGCKDSVTTQLIISIQ